MKEIWLTVRRKKFRKKIAFSFMYYHHIILFWNTIFFVLVIDRLRSNSQPTWKLADLTKYKIEPWTEILISSLFGYHPTTYTTFHEMSRTAYELRRGRVSRWAIWGSVGSQCACAVCLLFEPVPKLPSFRLIVASSRNEVPTPHLIRNLGLARRFKC